MGEEGGEGISGEEWLLRHVWRGQNPFSGFLQSLV